METIHSDTAILVTDKTYTAHIYMHSTSTSLHYIITDWSGMCVIPVLCRLFEHLHGMIDIKDLIMAVLVAKFGLSQNTVVKRLAVFTYDGVKVNEAFNLKPTASGINAGERQRRRAVIEQLKKVEESTCICHRLVKMEEHVMTYPDSEPAL
jgi:hypothetical protein